MERGNSGIILAILIMNHLILTGLIAASLFIAGCRKQPPSTTNPAASPPASTAATSAPTGAQSALTAWQQGDQTAAVSNFLATDWSARPLFAEGSTLNLSETQFKALTDADRQAKSVEMMAQLATLKQLAQAMVQSGQRAVAQGDPAQARKRFTSLKECGAALRNPTCLQLVQLVGKSFEQLADAELAKLGQ